MTQEFPPPPIESGVVHSRELGGVSGYAVGVLHIASPFAFVPGNIQNATTLPFPVAYECVPEVSLSELLGGQAKVERGLIAAARRLEARGVRVILGACGSFANFQRVLADSVSVPVCSSVLALTPWLLTLLPRRRRLGIVFADQRSFSARIREECGIIDTARLAVTDCMGIAPFRALIERPYTVAHEALESQVAAHARSFVAANSDIGMLVLQCSELAPYAAAIQRATDRPIVDINTTVAWAQSIAVRAPYSGYW